jgi:hypothetical protein
MAAPAVRSQKGNYSKWLDQMEVSSCPVLMEGIGGDFHRFSASVDAALFSQIPERFETFKDFGR